MPRGKKKGGGGGGDAAQSTAASKGSASASSAPGARGKDARGAADGKGDAKAETKAALRLVRPVNGVLVMMMTLFGAAMVMFAVYRLNSYNYSWPLLTYVFVRSHQIVVVGSLLRLQPGRTIGSLRARTGARKGLVSASSPPTVTLPPSWPNSAVLAKGLAVVTALRRSVDDAQLRGRYYVVEVLCVAGSVAVAPLMWAYSLSGLASTSLHFAAVLAVLDVAVFIYLRKATEADFEDTFRLGRAAWLAVACLDALVTVVAVPMVFAPNPYLYIDWFRVAVAGAMTCVLTGGALALDLYHRHLVRPLGKAADPTAAKAGAKVAARARATAASAAQAGWIERSLQGHTWLLALLVVLMSASVALSVMSVHWLWYSLWLAPAVVVFRLGMSQLKAFEVLLPQVKPPTPAASEATSSPASSASAAPQAGSRRRSGSSSSAGGLAESKRAAAHR